jgi:hypothetical protein
MLQEHITLLFLPALSPLLLDWLLLVITPQLRKCDMTMLWRKQSSLSDHLPLVNHVAMSTRKCLCRDIC